MLTVLLRKMSGMSKNDATCFKIRFKLDSGT